MRERMRGAAMTSRSWLLVFALANALCGLIFKNPLCEVIFVVTLVVLYGTRNSV